MGSIAERYAAQRAAQAQAAPTLPQAPTFAPPPPPSGIGGFLSNLWGNATDLVGGLGQLGGALLHDVTHAGAEALTLGGAGGEFLSDDIAKALPGAVWDDLRTRYGPLFRGDFGEFGHQLYSRPLDFGLDAFSAGAAGAKLAGMATKASPALAAGVEAARAGELASPLAKVASAFLPSTKPALIGSEVAQVTEAANPLTRTLLQRPVRRVLSDPVSVLEEEAGALRAAKEAGHSTPALEARRTELEALAAKARGAGIERVDKPFVSDWRYRRATDRMMGDLFSDFIRRREDDTRAFKDVLKPLAEAKLEGQAAGAFQRLDVEFEDLAPATEGAAAASAGGVATRVARRTTAPDPVLDQTMENARGLIQERFTRPLIEKGLLTDERALDRAYLPLKIKLGAKYDVKTGEWTGAPSTAELHAALTSAGIAPPIYFPHIDARRLRFSDFLRSSKLVGGRKAAKANYLKLNTGYLLKTGNYVTDPVEAYVRRAAVATRHEETAKLFDELLKRFGRRVGSMDEIGPHEALVAPDGLFRFFNSKLKFSDEVQDLLAAGMDEDAALADALKAAVFDLKDEAGTDIAREQLGVAKGPLYAVPKAVADRMERHAAPLFGRSAERGIRLFWDTPMNAWRGAVLTGSPRWLLNNFLGNAMFLKMQGGKLRDAVTLLEQRFARSINERFGTKLSTRTLEQVEALPGAKEAAGGFFRTEQQYLPRKGIAGESKTGQLIQTAKESRVGRGLSRYGAFMRRVNSEIEDAFRQASYLKAVERQQVKAGVRRGAERFWTSKKRLERIAENGTTDAQMRAALDEVNHFLADYSRMSPFERKVIRRFLFPFWSFYRHTAKLAVTYPIEYADRAFVLRQLAEVTKELAAEATGPVPPWLEGALPTGVDPETGEQTFLQTRGVNPFAGLLQPWTSSLNPALKVAIERATGRSLFTGKEFSDEGVVSAFGSDQRFRVDEQGRSVPVDKVVPGIFEHLAQQVPQYELAKNALAGGATYDTASIGDVAAGQGVIRDETGAPRYPYDLLEQLTRFGGMSNTSYDLAGYQSRLSEDQLAAIAYFLKSRGLAPPS